MSRGPPRGAVARRAESSDAGGRAEACWTMRTGRCGSSWRRRSARCRRDRERRAVASLLERHADDPIVVDAALSGVRGSEAAVLEKLLQSAAQTTAARDRHHDARGDDRPRRPGRGRSRALFGVDRGRWRGRPGSARRCCAARRSRCWARRCLERRDAARRGSPAAGGPAVSDLSWRPRRPGRRVRVSTRAAPRLPRGPRRPGRAVRLNREPAALSALAARSGELSSARAARARARRVAGQARRRGADCAADRRRAAAIRRRQEVYRNICQACHQPDGRGQDKLAPSLVGSPLALAAGRRFRRASCSTARRARSA